MLQLDNILFSGFSLKLWIHHWFFFVECSAVITRLHMLSYYTYYCNHSSKTKIRLWTHKKTPHGRDMGCLFGEFWKKNWLCYNGIALYLCWLFNLYCFICMISQLLYSYIIKSHFRCKLWTRFAVGWVVWVYHYTDVIMGTIASHITSLTIVYSTVYSDADHRKHQNSALQAFLRGIRRRPVNSSHKWSVTRKMLPFDDVIMFGTRVNVLFAEIKWMLAVLW